jgi:hypothetical protein
VTTVTSEEARSLDLVQRVVFSAVVMVVTGSMAFVLALYVALNQDQFSGGETVMLWVMTGVIGLITAIVVLLINRRRPLSPWLVLGLLPMAISAYWILR